MYGHSEWDIFGRSGVDSAAAAVGDAHGTARDP
jgi:fructose/tagatose bisphosphate aldolase